VAPVRTATLAMSLDEEAETVRWVHGEVSVGAELPLAEAEGVVRSLTVAMHGDSQMALPLLRLKDHDQYTTTHALNVSVLTMGLAEHLGLSGAEVRAYGIAGLLHDLGKVRIPREILNKPGSLTEEERDVMRRHPADGAQIILESGRNLELASAVAYEHHIMINGGGYPSMHFQRCCHHASELVHVCDVYDALRTHRPYRAAWESDRALAYIEERAGSEFEETAARAFVRMMRAWDESIVQEPTPTIRFPEEEAVPALSDEAPKDDYWPLH
jgi:putative nucleotidyltransferase with HDIG domain